MRTFTRKTNKQEKKKKLLTLLGNSKDHMFILGLAKPHTSLATGFIFGFQKLRAGWDFQRLLVIHLQVD